MPFLFFIPVHSWCNVGGGPPDQPHPYTPQGKVKIYKAMINVFGKDIMNLSLEAFKEMYPRNWERFLAFTADEVSYNSDTNREFDNE